MSQRKVDTEIVRKQCTNDASLIDEAEIIDVSAFNFDDTDGWLYIPTEYKTQSTVSDLYSWLKSEPELSLSGNRKSIDTRTFTRSKKRSSRTSFESILESLSSPVANTWKTSTFSNIEEDFSKYANIPTAKKEESVPSMLKMASSAKVSVLADEATATTGHESMEVFLNMSHSKGIDSFINLMEPGINDPLMNISQPSIFYSSITSLPRDDCLHNTECSKDEESTSLTHTYNVVTDKLESLNVNETFLKMHDQDNKKISCLSPVNETFMIKLDTNEKELNETYNADAASTTILLSNSEKDKSSTTLSSTFINKDGNTTKLLQSKSDEEKPVQNLNATFASTIQKVENPFVLDTTYSAREIEIASNDVTNIIKNDNEYNKNQLFDLEKTAIHNIAKVPVQLSTPSSNSSFSLIQDEFLNSTFKLPIPLCNQSTPKNVDALSSTYKTTNKQLETTRVYNTTLNSNMKAPTMLRKELLAEIYKSGDHRLDCTFEREPKDNQNGMINKDIIHQIPTQNIRYEIPKENRYNTYKKDSSVHKIKPHNEVVNVVGTGIQHLPDKKYYTFTKKSNNIHSGKTDMENATSLDNADNTFVKPLPKLQKQQQQHIPRMFSKLPQFLQKSNPNLVSSCLKTVNTSGGRNTAGYGYMKGSQPNIVRDVEKSLGNKLYPFGKLKSGSEQRLLDLNTGTELHMLGAGGSTESIESTQSAHSAPDLDDRLSTCSDSSHNSYTTRPMNIEQLHHIVRMQEESLKQDEVPQLNRPVSENTWVEVKVDLPSPILKNGIGNYENDSPIAVDDTVTTSTPILSPSKASQSTNTDSPSIKNVLKQQNEEDTEKKVEIFNKPVMKIENKTTRLRQPTNWHTGNRPTNVTSAIPRPASRIPAPRFAKTAVKNIQGDVKRGYI